MSRLYPPSLSTPESSRTVARACSSWPSSGTNTATDKISLDTLLKLLALLPRAPPTRLLFLAPRLRYRVQSHEVGRSGSHLRPGNDAQDVSRRQLPMA